MQRTENALDALLDELQSFAKPTVERATRGESGLRRLHSYPSGSDTDVSPPVRARGVQLPKPPVPERHPELLALAARRAPPLPPPRTTSRSPLASPPSPSSPSRTNVESNTTTTTPQNNTNTNNNTRQTVLEQRHQELLKKQKALQEQYVRLQMIQRSGSTIPATTQPDLKKTGSESNILAKMNLNFASANMSGSLTHLATDGEKKDLATVCSNISNNDINNITESTPTTNKVYETDIL